MICNICPRRCGAERTETCGGGFCRMPAVPVIARAGCTCGRNRCSPAHGAAERCSSPAAHWAASTARTTPSPPRGWARPSPRSGCGRSSGELIAQGAHNIDLITASHFVPFLLAGAGGASAGAGGVQLRRLRAGGDAASAGRKSADLAAGPEIRAGGARPALFPRPDYFPVATEAIREMFRQVGPCRMEDGLLRQGVVIRHLVLRDSWRAPGGSSTGWPGPSVRGRCCSPS